MPGSLPPEDEIARLRAEKDQGASPAGSGYSGEPEPVPVSALTGEYPSRRAAAEAAQLERHTTVVARRYGCDRDTFTVCWGEYERGEACRCKEEARSEIAED